MVLSPLDEGLTDVCTPTSLRLYLHPQVCHQPARPSLYGLLALTAPCSRLQGREEPNPSSEAAAGRGVSGILACGPGKGAQEEGGTGEEEEEGGGSAAAKTSGGETATGESRLTAGEAAVPCRMLTLCRSSACSRAFLSHWSCLSCSGLECPPSLLERLCCKGQAQRSVQCMLIAPAPSLLCRRCRRRRSGSLNAFLPNHILMTQRALRSFSSCLTIPEWSGDSTSHSH